MAVARSPATGTTGFLDNPAWHALCGPHRGVAEQAGPARRYHPGVSVFAAVDELDGDRWAALADLASGQADGDEGGHVVLVRPTVPTPPPGWGEAMRLQGYQMVLAPGATLPAPNGAGPAIRPLTADDVPAMLALVELAKPGPFLPGTIELGGYVGVERDGRLVAMAGRRMAVPGAVEVSAVCSHPDVAGQGLGSAVTAHVARDVLAGGATPFLHVTVDNPARRVYERLGFAVRRTMEFVALQAPAPARAPAPAGARPTRDHSG